MWKIVVQYTHLHIAGFIEARLRMHFTPWHHGPDNKPTTLPMTVEAGSTFQYQGM